MHLAHSTQKFEEKKYFNNKIWIALITEIIEIYPCNSWDWLTGKVTKKVQSWIKEIDVECPGEVLQKRCLLGATRIMQKV